jgi:predicted phosphoribosyltransferase
MLFEDRLDAGRQLARKLTGYANRPDTIVLALPRGGVPVAYAVATELRLPLDVFIVRKLGAPGHEEYAIGAIATGGVRILNQNAIRMLGLPMDAVERQERREREELARREKQYRGERPAPQLSGRTVVLVDDGLATGSTMRAAAAALRQQGVARIVVAVPVAPASTCREFESEADEVVCAVTPEPFYAVGQWYRDFSQTSDAEVEELLDRARRATDGQAA